MPLPEAEASYDEARTVTLLTEEGTRTLTLAAYLPGALAAEMPASFGAEALKAQAVAARTYVLRGGKHENADVCTDSACCLAYLDEDERRALWGGDYEENDARIREAVSATDGQILTYEGAAIQAVFHASSYGVTEASADLWSAQSYLVSVPTPETEETVPGLISRAVFTPEELKARLGIAPEGPEESWLGTPVPDGAGRVAGMEIGGAFFTGAELRALLGLRSTAFSASYGDGVFVFTAAGYGHGVGMSQYGAMLLAREGWDHRAILAHYYPGTVIQTLSPPAPG